MSVDEQIKQLKQVANDPQRHVGDRIEALCDLHDLYEDDPSLKLRQSETIDSIRELARTEI